LPGSFSADDGTRMLERVLEGFIRPRMPPGIDVELYAKMAARRFRPRDFATLTQRRINTIKYASLELIVPPWQTTYSSLVERERAGRYLLGRHAKKNPRELHQRLEDLPDEYQWAYLLLEFQKFNIEQTSTIMCVSRDAVESLCGKAHNAVHLIPPGKR
jgi:DNA-directed RNA polymerase specialized sigma24 family protein